MDDLRAGDTFEAYFTTQLPGGEAVDADSTPGATATQNGSDDTGGGSFTAGLSVTNIDTGLYKVSGTIPSGYAPGDRVTVRVSATVDGIAGQAVLAAFNIAPALSVIGSVDDASATTTSFIGAAGLSSTDDAYNDLFLVPTDGALAGIGRKIDDYVGSTRTFTLAEAFPSAPADGTPFEIVGRSE